MSERVDVLVAGAGPTGLMAAALLVRSGVSVRIVDKNESAVKESRALGLQARSLELFLKMGIEQPFLHGGLMADGAEIYFDGSKVAELTFDEVGRDDTPYGFVLFIPQSKVEAILVDDLQKHGIEVERECELTSLAPQEDGVLASLMRNGATESIECRYLVGADGSHSVVRKALNVEFRGGAYDSAFLLADCQVDGLPDGERLRFFIRQQRFGIQFPLLGQGLSRILVQVKDAANTPQGSSPATLEEVDTAFREVTHTDTKLSNPIWLSRYKVHHRGVDRYRVGRVFLAGDAAHIHSPAGGQGMNTGLQDVANLAWKLAAVLRHGAPDAVLDTYDAERRPIGNKVLHYTDRAFTALSQPQPGWMTAFREKVMPHIMGKVTQLSAVRSRAFHYVSQLGVRYHDSMVVADVSAARSLVRPGRRAPNAHLQRHLDLFDLLSGYEFDLLALSRKPLSLADVSTATECMAKIRSTHAMPLRTHLVGHCLARCADVVRTESSNVFSTYGLEGTQAQALVLVRPDGYVAASFPGFAWSDVEAFLRGLGGVQSRG